MFLFAVVGPVLGAGMSSLWMLGHLMSSPDGGWKAVSAALWMLFTGLLTGIAFLLGGPPALATGIVMGALQYRIARRRDCLWIALVGIAAGAAYEQWLLHDIGLLTACSGPAAFACALISRAACMPGQRDLS